jgi:hypothetical protein
MILRTDRVRATCGTADHADEESVCRVTLGLLLGRLVPWDQHDAHRDNQ